MEVDTSAPAVILDTSDAAPIRAGSKRKLSKEKRFRQNVKGYAKKGIFGRGSYLEEEQAKYFLNILDVLKEDFEDAESKETLAQNVLSETLDQEQLFATNQIASKVIDTLIGFGPVEVFEKYQEVLSSDIRTLVADKFASHVLQKLVYLSALRCNARATPAKADTDLTRDHDYNLHSEFSAEHVKKCERFVCKVSKFLLNNLEDTVTDQYANHVIRTCLLSLAGVVDSDAMEKASKNEQVTTVAVKCVEWQEILEEYANRLRMWPQFTDFPYENLTSGLLQSLFYALKVVNKDLLKSIAGSLLSESLSQAHEEHETKLKAFSTEASVRLVELLIIIAGKKLYSKIVCNLFVGNMKRLAELKCANFAVQKLFDNVKDKSEFELLFDELSDHFERILQIGFTGVILSICNACKRLNSKQIQFIKSLKSALHIARTPKSPDDLIVAILKLKPIESCLDSNNYINIHGSVILQSLLAFQKPIEIISGLMEMDNAKLIPLMATAKGSFVVDAFFGAPFVGEKSKIKFIKKFGGEYLDLATNKFGSRILEKLYQHSDLSQQSRIVHELAAKLNQLESVHCGFIISKKFKVGVYKQNPSRWENVKDSQNTVEKLFKDII